MKIQETIRIACVAGIAIVVLSEAASAQRTGHTEAYFGARIGLGETVDFAGGSSVETEDDLGFAFGFGHHFNENFLLSGEFGWSSIDYDGVRVAAPPTPAQSERISEELDTASMNVIATWHFRPGPLTPYASATLGWTWIDTNIATGPPQAACWWDPWWGYICTPVQETLREDSMNYGLGLGVRWEMNPGTFLRFGYEQRWLDIDHALGTPAFGALRLEIGSMF